MKKTGAWLAVYALEQIGVRYTFGIPGVHNTELYDELSQSEQITPILVTHEQCASFMADAISRTTDTIGCCAIVPAAGMTHAMSGIGEAYLDGIPLLVISGGIRRDSGRHYQLHDIDQQRVLDGITKAAFLVKRHDEVIPTIYKAFEIATSGEPGPVFVELSGDVQLFTGEVDDLPVYRRQWTPPEPGPGINAAARLIAAAKKPGIYLGWGAREATDRAIELAELLGAPVSTTLQGLSVFPAGHPLHTGMGFGPSAVPAARKAFDGCDCLIAVGLRFAELATGSYGMPIPENLIHIDINPEVFNKNYPAKVAIEADAEQALEALLGALKTEIGTPKDSTELQAMIRREKEAFMRSWTERINAERVTPGIFFRELRSRLADDAYVVVDDGNHTFLTAELFPVHRSKHLISPTDFNCMGYCVPATIGVKLTHPENQVVAIVGDGAFLMTGLEIVTASRLGLGAVFCVFNDGELAQISQFQQIPLNRKTCTVLGEVNLEGVAMATGAAYLKMNNDHEIAPIIGRALEVAREGRPVIVDVRIDYSRKSEFTQGVVKVNLGRFPFSQKLRFIGRAIKRHLMPG
ncbi:MAG: thiamine pyrophosphate-binding protein [Acidobacteriota bacterium]|nr:MAG: thiamine pyrophosphate-binding protein [Acidobacteriota bacterium]